MTSALARFKGQDLLIEALRVPGLERTNEQLEPIIEFVRGLKIFASFSTMHPDTLRMIATKLELHSYYANSHIFTEGDPGYHFYIVLDGEVAIVRRRTVYMAVEGDVATETVVLVKLTCGKYFGENALESKEGLRTASAVATKRTRLLSLHADDYQSILSEFKAVVKETARTFLLSSASLFKSLAAEGIEHLASFANVRNYSVNEEIVKAGTKCSNLMVIKSGMVKLIKAIPRKELKALEKRADYKIRHNNLDGSGFGCSTSRGTKKLFAGSASASLTASIGNTLRGSNGVQSKGPLSPSSPSLRAAGSAAIQSTARKTRFSIMSESSEVSHDTQGTHFGQVSDVNDQDVGEDDEEEGDGLPAGYWLLEGTNGYTSIPKIGGESTEQFGAYQAPGEVKHRRVSSCEELVAEASAAIEAAQGLASFSEAVSSDADALLERASRSVKADQRKQNQRETELMKRPSMVSRNSAAFDSLMDTIDDTLSTKSRDSSSTHSQRKGVPPSRRKELHSAQSQETTKPMKHKNRPAGSNLQRQTVKTTAQKGPTEKDRTDGDKVEFTVAVLLPGQVIGELTILDSNMESPISAIASTAVEMYCFDQRILSDAMIDKNSDIMNALKDDWKFRNPPVGEICKRARAKYEWAAQKQQIMRYYFKK